MTDDRGFDLSCPRCGATPEVCSISLRLDLPDDEFQCSACDAEFGVAEVRLLVGRWSALLAWLDTIPNCRD